MQTARKCGIHAVEGGSHPDWGTANTLCYFDLSYIEYLGVENPAVAEKAKGNSLVRQALEDLSHGEGPARIALRTDDLAEAARLLEKQGWKTSGPFPGSRTSPDGTLLRWSLLYPEGPDGELPPPVPTRWERSDEGRREELRRRGAVVPQPAVRLRRTHVAGGVRAVGRAAKGGKGFSLKPKR